MNKYTNIMNTVFFCTKKLTVVDKAINLFIEKNGDNGDGHESRKTNAIYQQGLMM